MTVDDDPMVSAAIARDFRSRYGADYRVVRASSGAEALEAMRRLLLRDEPIALVCADQRMPGMSGIELLAHVREQVPDAKLLLLTAYADTDVAITAINEIGLDHYLLKPWDPPDERLYPVVDDLLGDWRRAHPEHTSDVRIVGHRWSERSHDLKTFLARNHVPYRWFDVERDEEGSRLVDLADAATADLPLVLVPDGEVLRAPTILELAAALGLRTTAERELYDVCIVGGGPAGLAAAVYAASEGLSTVVVEQSAPGGQAGQSASIENYLGFPRGLSGADLAGRALAQARRFGAELVLARDVVALEARGPVRAVRFDGGDIEARAVIIATGVSYRTLEAEGLPELIGRGVYYGANASEAAQCQGDEVYVVGAANSAGQAALNLARFAKRVHLVVRGATIEETMSEYLVERILASETIEVHLRAEVVAAAGDGHLERLTLADRDTGERVEVEAGWLFIFIGASPRTDWLGDEIRRDDKGFVVTGNDLKAMDTAPVAASTSPATSASTSSPPSASGSAPGGAAPRAPFALETSLPGVFAAGDVRLDSMKRVASAVGEGAMSVYFVHRYLATI
ncbi:response regulator [Humibacillus xanthopallidus]